MDGGTHQLDAIRGEIEAPDRQAPDRQSSKEADRQRQTAGVEAEQAAPPPRQRRLLRGLIGLVLLAGVAGAGTLYWRHASHYESTDDAFIDADQTQVSPRVSGPVAALLVTDNQHVEAGQVLLRLDPRDYDVKRQQSAASLASSQAQVEQAEADLVVQQASLAEADAQVRVSEADLQQAQQDLARYRGVNPAAITHQQLDQSNATAKSDAAKLDSARQAVLGAAAQVKAQQAKIDAARASKTQAEADLRNADLQLGYTIITAPRAGRVTKRSVNLGNYVTPGQALLAIVPDQMWVTANFKETQLTLMRVGQPVELHVDAFPDHPLHGTVESLQRGTGAVFSSLPAENATGNYVKVVQRVPVKIVFDGDDWESLGLAPGLSVTPTVTVR